MTVDRIIWQRWIMISALAVSVAALPFSVKICHAAIIVVILNWMFEGSWGQKVSIIRQSILLQLTISLFVIQVLGLAFSDNLTRGWFSLEKKIFFVVLPIVFATSIIRLTRREVVALFGTFVVSCFAGTLVCLQAAWLDAATTPVFQNLADAGSIGALSDTDSAYWVAFSYVSLAAGIRIHPTYFSLYLAVCILFVLSFAASRQTPTSRIIAAIIIVYFTIFVMLLSSRIIIIGVCSIYFFLLVRSVWEKRTSLGFLAAGGSIILIAMLMLNPVSRYRNLEAVRALTFAVKPDMHYTTAAQIRASLWWLAVTTLKTSNHTTGSGTGDVQKVMAARSASFNITNIIHSFDPHNQFLYTWIANGLPALLVLLLCLLIPTWCAWSKRDTLLLGFMFLFALVCMTESALELQKGIACYALVSSILFYQQHALQEISVNFRTVFRADQQS